MRRSIVRDESRSPTETTSATFHLAIVVTLTFYVVFYFGWLFFYCNLRYGQEDRFYMSPVVGRLAYIDALTIIHVLLATWIGIHLFGIWTSRTRPRRAAILALVMTLGTLGASQYLVSSMRAWVAPFRADRIAALELIDEGLRLEAAEQWNAAIDVYERAFERHPVAATQGVERRCWLYATSESPPREALELACQQISYEIDSYAYDSLNHRARTPDARAVRTHEIYAAGLARLGIFDKAVAIQREAIALSADVKLDAARRDRMRERLAAYESGRSWSDRTGP